MLTKKIGLLLFLLLSIITISTPIYAVDSTNPADYFFYDNMEGGALTNTYANISNSSYTSRFAGQGSQSLQINSSNNVTIRTNILGANFTTIEYSSPFCLNYMVYENSSAPADNQEAGITFKAWANAISHNRNSGGSSANLTYINNSAYTSIGSPIGQNTWANITVCFTSGYSASGFTTGIFLRNGVNTANNSFVPRSDLSTIGFNNRLPSGGGMYIDLLRIWNYTLYGTSAPPDLTAVNPNITLSTRTPADITNTNLFSLGFATYNYTYNFSNVVTGYWANSTLVGIRDCLSYINGSCSLYNNTKILSSPVSNYTVGNVTVQQYNFSENYIYPTTSNINYSLLSTYGIFNITLSSNNDYYQDEILNISNITNYGYYEVPANSTGILRVYYYNRSYDFSSNPVTSNNVHEFCVLTNITAFNHSHGSYGHQICPFLVNSSGYVGTVKMIGGGFLIRGNTQGITLYLANVTARTNVTRHTTNGGNTWSAVTGTILSHLHQFSGIAQFCVRGEGNYSGTIRNSTITCDTLDISYLPPEPSMVYVPNSTVTYNRSITIYYEFAIPQYTDSYITSYNISLYNSDFTLNSSIVTGLSNTTNTYNWNTYAQTLRTDRNYIVGVTATDSTGGSSTGFGEEFNVSTNSLLNVTARTLFGNGTITNTTNFTLYENGVFRENKTGFGTVTFDVIRGNNYTVFVVPAGYTNQTANVTLSTNSTTLFTYHYTQNSFVVQFYNETSKALLTQNITLQVITSTGSTNYSVTGGLINITFLTPADYTLRYWLNTQPSIPRDYYTTLVPLSYQNLTLFIVDEAISQYYLPIIQDQNSRNVENATIRLMRYYVDTNSYEVVEMSKTDTNGQAVLRVVPNYIFYKLMVTKDSKTLTTEPAKITASTNTYTINLRDSPLTSYYNGFEIYKNLTFNTVTNTFVFTWNDPTNIVTQGCLVVYKNLNGIETTDLNQCDNGASGSIIHSVTDDNESIYSASAYLDTNTQYSSIGGGQITIDFRGIVEGFGLIGVFIAVIVVLGFALIGGENGTRGTVVIGALAFLMLGAYGIIFYAPEVFIGILIIAGVIIYKLRGG